MKFPINFTRTAPTLGGCAVACLLLACAAALVAEEGGDPDGGRNRAATSELPRGTAGIADAHPGDRGIGDAPEVIFADDFEAAAIGDWGGWDEATEADKNVLSVVDPGDPDGRLGARCLRVVATLGENTGGGLTKWFESADAVFIRFYTRFDPDCDYVHHFCTLRANKGLRGGEKWSGFGGAGIKPSGDERFSTALEPWGNWSKWPAPGKWNFYSYWHEMTDSPDGKFWGNAFRPAKQDTIGKGEWICCEFMLRHNTPGKPDGEQAFWIDGDLRGHWTGINWRKSAGLRANALTLESYITDRWTKHPVNTVCFDNVVVARSYIGPTPKDGSVSVPPASHD